MHKRLWVKLLQGLQICALLLLVPNHHICSILAAAAAARLLPCCKTLPPVLPQRWLNCSVGLLPHSLAATANTRRLWSSSSSSTTSSSSRCGPSALQALLQHPLLNT
jgi:hypothetical protein